MTLRNLGAAVTSADPSATALIDLGGGAPRSFNYADIQRLSDACARGLLRRGLQLGERVAILAANRAEYLIAFLGTMRAGLVSVPVNYKLPAETVNFIIEDADVRLVLCDATRSELLRSDVPHVVIDKAFGSLLDDGEWAAVEAEPTEPAMFLYTSGSTGRPKGVVLSHRSHLWVLKMRATPTPPPGQRVLVAAPLYHMNASLSLSGRAEHRRHNCPAAVIHRHTIHRCRVPLPGARIDGCAYHDRNDATRARCDGSGRLLLSKEFCGLVPPRCLSSSIEHPPGNAWLRIRTVTAPLRLDQSRWRPSCDELEPPPSSLVHRIPPWMCAWCATAWKSRMRACWKCAVPH